MTVAMNRCLLLVAAALTFVSSCSQYRVLFRPDPPIVDMNDRSGIEQPEKRDYNRYAYTVDLYLNRQLDNLIDPVDPPPAMNVNSLGEVPNSSWFTNRMGIERMTRQEVAQGSAQGGSPRERLPWTVSEIVSTNSNRMLRIIDATGARYTLRFGSDGTHEEAHSAEAIASRLMYASGYNTLESHVVNCIPSDLQVDSAAAESGAGPSTDELDAFIGALSVRDDGSYRAVAIRSIDGVDCGVAPMTGTRADDPNDLIPHEHRRELRALKMFYAWLGHVDVTPDNTLDAYVEGEDGSYLKHYLTDFGDCFGTYFLRNTKTHPGFEHRMLDIDETATDMFSFGLTVDMWERLGRASEAFASQYYQSELFDIDSWKPVHPVPWFMQMTPQDAFWAARIISQFGDEHLNGAIGAGVISKSSELYLLDVLKKRRVAILEQVFSEINPLDDFKLEIKRQGVVFDFTNLATRHSIVSKDDLEYDFRIMNKRYDLLIELQMKSQPQYLIPEKEMGLSGEDNYLIVEIITRNVNTGEILPPVRAHFHGGKQTGFTLIGIERDS